MEIKQHTANRWRFGGVFACRYLYLLRGSGVPGANDGSPRNFKWNPRPIFQHGRDMPFEGYEDYLPGSHDTLGLSSRL